MAAPWFAAHAAPRVLVVDGHLLTPDRDGGSLRLFNILTLLVELGCRVTFVPKHPAAEPETAAHLAPYVAQMRAAGVEVITGPQITTLRQHLEAHGPRYAVVMLSGGVYHAYAQIPQVRALAPQASLWFDTVDLAYVREYRLARLHRNMPGVKRALYLKRLELEAATEADWTLVVSPEEAAVLNQAAPRARVHVLSNVHHVYGSAAPFEARCGLIFIGAYQHAPNLDGLRWFLDEVFPRLRVTLPGVRLTIIGADPPPQALALAAPDVLIAGYVADLAAVYNAGRLSIAPLRFGAGVKGKVLLSMGYGVPVVGTRVAAEGSFLVDGENVRLGDTPAAFAQAVEEAYSQPALWHNLSRNGLATVTQHFSFDSARRHLRHLLAQALPAGPLASAVSDPT